MVDAVIVVTVTGPAVAVTQIAGFVAVAVIIVSTAVAVTWSRVSCAILGDIASFTNLHSRRSDSRLTSLLNHVTTEGIENHRKTFDGALRA